MDTELAHGVALPPIPGTQATLEKIYFWNTPIHINGYQGFLPEIAKLIPCLYLVFLAFLSRMTAMPDI